MSTSLRHDPLPDGSTGPWLRGPSHRSGPPGTPHVFDYRCNACRADRGLGPIDTAGQRRLSAMMQVGRE